MGDVRRNTSQNDGSGAFFEECDSEELEAIITRTFHGTATSSTNSNGECDEVAPFDAPVGDETAAACSTSTSSSSTGGSGRGDGTSRGSFAKWTPTIWTCEFCTFINEPLHLICAVCEKARGAAAAATASPAPPSHPVHTSSSSYTTTHNHHHNHQTEEEFFLEQLKRERLAEMMELQVSILRQVSMENSSRSNHHGPLEAPSSYPTSSWNQPTTFAGSFQDPKQQEQQKQSWDNSRSNEPLPQGRLTIIKSNGNDELVGSSMHRQPRPHHEDTTLDHDIMVKLAARSQLGRSRNQNDKDEPPELSPYDDDDDSVVRDPSLGRQDTTMAKEKSTFVYSSASSSITRRQSPVLGSLLSTPPQPPPSVLLKTSNHQVIPTDQDEEEDDEVDGHGMDDDVLRKIVAFSPASSSNRQLKDTDRPLQPHSQAADPDDVLLQKIAAFQASSTLQHTRESSNTNDDDDEDETNPDPGAHQEIDTSESITSRSSTTSNLNNRNEVPSLSLSTSSHVKTIKKGGGLKKMASNRLKKIWLPFRQQTAATSK